MNFSTGRRAGSIVIRFRALISAVTLAAVFVTTFQPALAFTREGECEVNPFPDTNPVPAV